MEESIIILIEFKNNVQLYHWKTKDYAKHIASGDLYTSLDKLLDKLKHIRKKLD